MLTDHLFRRLNLDDPEKDLEQGDYTYALNLFPSKEARSTSPRRESVRGTVQIANGFIQSGDRCIGAYEDKANSRLIFFNLAASGNHGIYLYDGSSVSQIYQSSTLQFSSSKLITQISVIENFLGFIDSEGRQMILNIEFGLAGDYNSVSADNLILTKRRPINIPTAQKSSTTDGTIQQNIVCFNSYKFYVRYILKDGSKTVFSNSSVVVPATRIPDESLSQRSIFVNYTVESSEILSLIDKIEFAYEIANNGILNVYASVTPTVVSNNARFTAQETYFPVAADEWAKPYEDVPKESSAFTFFKNRTFINRTAQDYEDDGNYTITASAVSTSQPSGATAGGTGYTSEFYSKKNGLYSVGVAFYDQYNNISPILKRVNVSVPFYEGALARISATVNGTMPTWARKAQFFITEELRYEAYMQVPANILYYRSDGDTAGANEFIDGDAIYLNERHSVSPSINTFTYIHFQLPTNVPFVPDTECLVRVINKDEFDVTNIEGVIEVRGDKIVTDTFGFTNTEFDAIFGASPYCMIEIYKQKESTEDIYYAYPEIYNISGGTLNVTSTLKLDTSFLRVSFKFPSLNNVVIGNTAIITVGDFSYYGQIAQTVESPSPTINTQISSSVSTSSLKKVDNLKSVINDFYKKATFGIFGIDDELRKYKRNVSLKAGYVIDYSKSVSNLGFPNVFFDRYKESNLSTSISYSDLLVQDTNINGLRTFFQANRYTLDATRGPITALVSAKEVLLAIHERFVTSIYIGEGFIRQGDDAILAKTEGVIGDDRVLRGQYGCINPESIAEHDGRVWFFDLLKGEPVRYDNNGLTPLGSTYKMATYFRQKSKERIDYKDTCKIYGGYNPDLDLYFLTFEAIPEAGLPSETIAFLDKQGREGWVSWYSFDAEYYSSFNNSMISFKEGRLYIHDTASQYNSFYGNGPVAPEITFVCNEGPNMEKRWDNISYIGSQGWTSPNITNNQGQKTSLVANDFVLKNGTYYADILRDENTGGDLLRPGEIPLLSGKEMVSQYLLVNMKGAESSSYQFIDNAQVGFNSLTGQFNKAESQ